VVDFWLRPAGFDPSVWLGASDRLGHIARPECLAPDAPALELPGIGATPLRGAPRRPSVTN